MSSCGKLNPLFFFSLIIKKHDDIFEYKNVYLISAKVYKYYEFHI